MEGMARYASTWSALFHMRVPTGSPSRTPSAVSACARRVARSPTSANVRRSGAPSPVQVVTTALPWTPAPWAMIRVTVSGTSCIVLCTGGLPILRVVTRGSFPVILLAYPPVSHYPEDTSPTHGVDPGNTWTIASLSVTPPARGRGPRGASPAPARPRS